MEQIVCICFFVVKCVIDCFYVQKLVYEVVQEMWVKVCWEVLDEEFIQIVYVKVCGKMYYVFVFVNGDIRKQLLVRSIYLFYKKEFLWIQF